jgi:hypothetical protein
MHWGRQWMSLFEITMALLLVGAALSAWEAAKDGTFHVASDLHYPEQRRARWAAADEFI